MTNLVGRGWH
ncbi:hypothetical protein ACHAXS_000231 [Conticribra weissflogii]